MTSISKHIGQGFGKGELYDTLIQMQSEAGMLPISGETYFVSKTGNGIDGLTWETAFKTVAAAIAASNTYIAVSANSYGRNRMYIDGGNLWAETIVTLPNQCDMIGVGARTGWRPTIYGCTTVATAVTGCHIYNIMFYNTTASEPVVTIPDGSHGIEFHKCQFSNGDGNNSTVGLKLGSIADLVVDNCRFSGNPPSVIGILLDGTLAMGQITNNFIGATTTGIQIADGTTGDYGLLIKDNVIGRPDPNSSAQMTNGILISDTNSRCHTFFVNNYISAADAINFVGAGYGTMDEWLCIGNTIVEAGTSTMETVIVDG